MPSSRACHDRSHLSSGRGSTMPKGKRNGRGKARVVPYIRGFKPPSPGKCVSAISHPPLSLSSLPSHLKPNETSFSKLAKPTSVDDWLAQYNEPGQNYAKFLRENPWLSTRKWRGLTCEFNSTGKTITERYKGTSIYLVPLGDLQSDTNLAPKFTDLIEYVELFYNLPVKSIDNVTLNADKPNDIYLTHIDPSTKHSLCGNNHYHLDSRYDSKTQHRQLRVRSILTALRQFVPKDALFVIALTMEDLYEDNPDLFVAGMAAGNHRVGVFSFSRYDPTCTFSPEHWYDIKRKETTGKKREENKRIVLQRSCKLLVHELAHLLGVDHCIWYNCCMNGSGHLMEDFRQSMFLCPVDLNKLQTLCGFDVIERYQKMAKYFMKHGLEEEQQWVEKRLSEINS